MEWRLFGQISKWILITFVGIVTILAGLEFCDRFLNVDTDIIIDALATRIPLFILGICCLIGATMAFEAVTPGNYLSVIRDDPKACSYLMGAFLLAVALVIAYV